ncbi:uncharacterized protein LOC119080269 [Bradysia coprophila]|uniref:uncharacterized protein LOC119080269 n=1 Tax=Bradysia coprophila TaxID=38358 RepID=UPI00187D8ECB|nr:uncharacterized protein LOC119080269 [Bradysia coprophila]
MDTDAVDLILAFQDDSGRKALDSIDIILALEGEDDEDVAVADFILNTKNRVYHYLEKEPGTFNLADLGDSYCHTHFRFYKDDITRLISALGIPNQISLDTRVKVSGEEALCILLHRLSYPKRYADQMKFFPRGRSALSGIFNFMVDFISKGKGRLLKSFDHTFLSQDKIEELCSSIAAMGSPYKRCFGFIDGTVRAVCRPIDDQREFYNGHKRVHSIKYQSIMLPNGIIFNMFGSVVGRRHDGHMLARSKTVAKLERKFRGWENPPHLYGDAGYPLSKELIVPFKGRLTKKQQTVNKRMSRLRVSVEWGFAKIIQLFPFVDFKKKLRIRHEKVPDFYKVATILANCHTCLYGSQVCQYFEMEPPTLEEYLN